MVKITLNKRNKIKLKKSTKRTINIEKDNKLNLGALFSKILLKNNINVFFGVPSDLNMPMLDEMLKEPVKFIGCRNELNSSYMSEGFSRTKPFSICIVGSMVGSLSASNGIANSICEKNPVLLISGSNNSNDELDGKLSHHTLFKGINDQSKSYEIFISLCGEENAFKIDSLNSANIFNTINNISNSLTNFTSPYLHIPANFQKIKGNFDYSDIISTNFKNNILKFEQFKFYNIVNELIKTHYNNDITKITKLNPVFLFGSAYNHYSKFINLTDDNFYNLMESIGAVMCYTIDSKGILDETKQNVIGHYWGGVTEEYILQHFENSKALIYIGVELSDYTSSGYTCLFSPHIAINCKNISIVNRNKKEGKLNKIHLNNPCKILSLSITDILDSNTDVFVETGSSWFYGAGLKLPKGCRFNISSKYGSIGWCFPASIGNSFANPTRKTICLTGDGAFQCVLQELVTPQTYNLNLTLILINNDAYQIENVLDSEEYNDLPKFNYEDIAKAMNCKSVITCSINNFGNTLKKYNALHGFNIIILKISDKIINNLMENWAKLVSKYTTHYP